MAENFHNGISKFSYYVVSNLINLKRNLFINASKRKKMINALNWIVITSLKSVYLKAFRFYVEIVIK